MDYILDIENNNRSIKTLPLSSPSRVQRMSPRAHRAVSTARSSSNIQTNKDGKQQQQHKQQRRGITKRSGVVSK